MCVQFKNVLKTKVNTSFLSLFNFLVMILINWFSRPGGDARK